MIKVYQYISILKNIKKGKKDQNNHKPITLKKNDENIKSKHLPVEAEMKE